MFFGKEKKRTAVSNLQQSHGCRFCIHRVAGCDDSVTVSLLSSDEHAPVVGELTDWCSSIISPVLTGNQTVEMVHIYKYLDANIDDKPKIRNDPVWKKAQQFMSFYTKLHNFNVDSALINVFFMLY